jgi:hypothetical protein
LRQWSLGSAPWTNRDACHLADRQCPYGAGDHHDAALIVFFFSTLLPNGSMMKTRGSAQLGWGTAPNHGRHMTGPGDPMERHRGLRAPSAGTPASLGKGTRAAPTLNDVAKAAMVVGMQSDDRTTMAPTITMTAAAMVWVVDFVQKRHDEIGKHSCWHLTEFLFFDLSLCSPIEGSLSSA